MLDDFFVRALFAGVGVACIAGPLGAFVVWRRMAYFGATLSHSALLGVALALLVGVDPMAGVVFQSLVVIPALVVLERRSPLSSDSHLGILAHGTLALGLVIFGFMTSVRVDLMGYLFGDILAVSKTEITIVYLAGVLLIGALLWIWRPLLAATVNAEIAAAEGLQPERNKIIFMFLVAGVIAIGMKVVGILLILSLLIIPPAAARAFSTSPEQMAVGAALVGVVSVVAGLSASRWWDTPSGPSIVVAAVLVFVLSLLPVWRYVLPKYAENDRS
ncbi:MAG TPA: iron chelate uptake ABC transporter family permease subunit [Hyphomicrobiaceae bacterium]|nr:iron chelate uptake ABC transporter family permease subunit [Hyphomicrobiaceae bacterium]